MSAHAVQSDQGLYCFCMLKDAFSHVTVQNDNGRIQIHNGKLFCYDLMLNFQQTDKFIPLNCVVKGRNLFL